VKRRLTIIIIMVYFLFLPLENCVYSQTRNLDIYRESQQAQLVTMGNAIAWSPESDYIAVGYKDKVLVLKLPKFQIFKRLHGQINNVSSDVTSVVFTSDGQYLLSGHKGGIIFIWSTKTWKNIMRPWSIPMPWTLNCGLVPSLSFNSKRDLLASGDWDNNINIWSRNKWKHIKSFKNAEISRELSNQPSIFQSIQLQVRSIDFSPDGQYLATGGNDRFVRIWDIKTWENVQSLGKCQHWISSVAFSPAEDYLAASDHNGVVYVWDTHTWNFIQRLDRHNLRCLCVTFSRDGKYLASGGDNGEIFIFDTKDWSLVKELKDLNNSVYSLAFSNNGEYLVTKSTATIIVWSADNWTALKKISM